MPAPSSSSSSTRRIRTVREYADSAHRREQRLDLLAAARVGERPVRARPRLERPGQRLARGFVVPLAVKEAAEEVIRIDALRVERQRLLQQLARLAVVAEADRPARYLIVKGAEARVRGSLQRL